MSIAYLHGNNGGGVDPSSATAKESEVLQGKTFFAGSDEVKTGTLRDRRGTALQAASGTLGEDRISLQMPEEAAMSAGSALYCLFSALNPALSSEQLLEGASVLGVEGTMPDCGAVQATVSAGQSFAIPRGYHNGQGVVQAVGAAKVFTGRPVSSGGLHVIGNLGFKPMMFITFREISTTNRPSVLGVRNPATGETLLCRKYASNGNMEAHTVVWGEDSISYEPHPDHTVLTNLTCYVIGV